MVKEKHKPEDGEYREEEEAMLREMVKNNFLERGDDYVRFGPPRASRIFLVEELTVDRTTNLSYPEDVEEKPKLIRRKYEEYRNN